MGVETSRGLFHPCVLYDTLPLHLINSLNMMRLTWKSSSGGMQKKKYMEETG